MTPEEADREIVEALGAFAYDFEAFVMWAFPWGVEGGPLADEDGPDEWQRDQLRSVSKGFLKGHLTGDWTAVREATASGHGIGKSCLVAWLVIASLLTYEDSRVVVTANTDTQLRTKTWAELNKWFYMLHPALQAKFTLTATALYSSEPGKDKTWRADAIPWSETNPAAFAGAHNAGKRLLVIMDEASEIADVIWDTAEGAMTDDLTELALCVYGNPTQPVGRFRECVVGRYRSQWRARQIDGRNVKRTNKSTIATWVATFGEDSDFVRVRVKGQFPRVGMTQFIPSDMVEKAKARPALYIPSDPILMGVDVAWYGDDRSVIAFRRGNDAKTIPWQQYRGADPMFLAGEVMLFAQKFGVDAVFVDATGMGAGVYARLHQLGLKNCYPVLFGNEGGNVEFNGVEVRTKNKRTAIWAMMREWLRLGGALPDKGEMAQELDTDLCVPQYKFAGQNDIELEPKDQMRKRGFSSPDLGDALACTFAYPVAPRATQIGPPEHFDPYRASREGQSTVSEVDNLYRDLR